MLFADLVVVGVWVSPFRHHLVVTIDERLNFGNTIHNVAPDIFIGVKFWFLSEVTNGEPRRESSFTGVAIIKPRHDFQQTRLTRTIRPDNADFCPGVERQRDVL